MAEKKKTTGRKQVTKSTAKKKVVRTTEKKGTKAKKVTAAKPKTRIITAQGWKNLLLQKKS